MLNSQPSTPVHQPRPMIHFDNARRELKLALTVDEVKDIRDKAEAMRLYCRQARHSLEMQNQCDEIKLRAERRAGEMLSEVEKNRGGQVEHQSYLSFEGTGRIPKSSKLGISRIQSSKWQRISEIPEASFEEFIEATKSKEKELTSSGALLLARDIQRQRTIADLERDIEIAPTVPEQRYHVVVIDPAWHYHLRQGQIGRRNKTPYPTMSIEEIKVPFRPYQRRMPFCGSGPPTLTYRMHSTLSGHGVFSTKCSSCGSRIDSEPVIGSSDGLSIALWLLGGRPRQTLAALPFRGLLPLQPPVLAR